MSKSFFFLTLTYLIANPLDDWVDQNKNVIKEKPLKPSRKKNQQQELFRLEREPTLINKLWQRMREHPFTESLISLEVPKDTK